MTVFKTARGRAAPDGREKKDVRSRRVSSTHACKGRWSRRLEISSRGLVGLWLGTTRTGVVCLVAAVLTLATTFFFDFPAAGWAAAVGLGLGFLSPTFFLVAVTLGCLSTSVTGRGGAFGLGGGVVAVALATRPPRTTCLHPLPRANCSAEGPACWAFGRQGHSWGLAVAPALQAPPSLLSTSHSHGSSLCGYPHSNSTEAVPAGLSTHRTGGSPHTRHSEARNRSFAACVRSAGSACIA